MAWGAQLREMGSAFGLHLLHAGVSQTADSVFERPVKHARSFDVPRFYNSSRADAATRNMILDWMTYPIVPAPASRGDARRRNGQRGRTLHAAHDAATRRHTAHDKLTCRVPKEERESKSREHA